MRETRRDFLRCAATGISLAGSSLPSLAQPDNAIAAMGKGGAVIVRSRLQLLCDQTLLTRGSSALADWPHHVRFGVATATKHPQPLYSPHLPWESPSDAGAGGFWAPSVLYDGGKYRLWYNAYGIDSVGGLTREYDKVAYAESDDGIDWKTPDLNLVEWQGSKKNNLVFDGGRPDGWMTTGQSVFIDPNAKPNERYKMVYLDSTGRPHSRITLRGAYSPDGLHWERYPEIFSAKFHDTQNVGTWDPLLGKYVAYVRSHADYGELSLPPDAIRAASRGRAVGRMESNDFRNWSTPEICLSPDINDPLDMDFYTNGYSVYPGADRVHFMFPAAFHYRNQKINIQVAVSRDNRNWVRPSRDVFVPNGPDGSYDAGIIYISPGIVDAGGDQLALYSQVATGGHDDAVRQKSPYHGFHMGRVTFPRGRILGVQSDEGEGFFSTRDLLFSGRRLEVNAEPIAQGGYLRIEIASIHTRKALPGFSFGECEPIDRSSLRHAVRWRGSDSLGEWAGKPVRVRFSMRDMRLYSIQFVEL